MIGTRLMLFRISRCKGMTRYEKHSESAADLLSFQVLQGQKWHQEVKSSLARAPHPHFQRPCWGRYGEIAALGAIGVSKVYTNNKAPTSCFARHLKILMFPRFLHRPTCEMRIAKGSPDITSVFSLCPVRVSCQPDKHSRASWQRSGFLLQIALKMLVAPLHESVNFGFRLFRLLRSFEGWIGFCQLPWVTRILQTRVLRAGASLSVTRCPASRCKKWRGIEG